MRNTVRVCVRCSLVFCSECLMCATPPELVHAEAPGKRRASEWDKISEAVAAYSRDLMIPVCSLTTVCGIRLLCVCCVCSRIKLTDGHKTNTGGQHDAFHSSFCCPRCCLRLHSILVRLNKDLLRIIVDSTLFQSKRPHGLILCSLD